MSTRMRTAVLVLLTVALSSGVVSAAPIWTFSGSAVRATEDAAVRERYPGPYNANDISIRLSSNTLQYDSNNPGGHYNQMPIMQFDLGITPDWNIVSVTSATLSVYGNHPAGKSYRYFRLTETFEEETVDWITRPARDTSAYVDLILPASGFTWHTVDISSLLLNNGTSPTLGIQFEFTPDTWAAWATSHNYSKETGSHVAPRISFEFQAEYVGNNPGSVPEPATLSLVGLGLVGLARRLRRRS